MKPLIGTWHGQGRATYPTIQPANYREEVTFLQHPDRPVVHMEQKTWRLHDDGTESLLFWESGFIRQLEGNNIEWVNVQFSGRLEALKGTLSMQSGLLVLDFESAEFANDPRMIQSVRRLEVEGDVLRYELMMATQAHPTLATHLEAELHRV